MRVLQFRLMLRRFLVRPGTTPTIGHVVSTMLLVAGCAAPPADPAPAPRPVPAEERPPSRATPPAPARTAPPRTADTATRATARRDSTPPAARPRRAGSTAPRGRLPRGRTDTLAPRELGDSIRLCSGGDVTLGSNLDRDWARNAALKLRTSYGRSDLPSELVGPLKPIVERADVVLLNVESAIGEGPSPSKCGPRSTNCFAFRAPTSAAGAFRSVAPSASVVANVANNHSRDAGPSGQVRTVELLRRAGVFVTGFDTIATAVPTPAGDTIGVLGFYTSVDSPDARDTSAVYRHVARASARYPVVVVTMHLGGEGLGAQRTRDATEVFLRIDRGNPVAFADAAVRGGAALIVGHGPHVLRAMEWTERGALIAYSLGNLLTYGPFTNGEPRNRGAVLCATIDRTGRVAAATVVSTVQLVPGVLEADRDARAATLIDSLGRLDFRESGARVERDGAVRPRSPRARE